MPTRDIIAIIGIDHLLPKNRMQLNCMAQLGYQVDVFPYATGDARVAEAASSVHVLEQDRLKAVVSVLRYLYRMRNRLHHIEVYVGGWLSFAVLLWARFWGIVSLGVERGELYNYPQHSSITRWIMKYGYRLCSSVWYRELYMERVLDQLGVVDKRFIHNAIDSEIDQQNRERDLTFLWVNRLVPARRFDWFLNVLSGVSFDGTRNAALGISEHEKAKLENGHASCPDGKRVDLLPFQPPAPYYVRSRFFVLPAEIVFCNNALLEAMASGVVPLVSAVEGANLIVDDGVNGIIFEHSEAGLKEAMSKALALSDYEWEEMSMAARRKVNHDFSSKTWCARLQRLYSDIAQEQ